MPLTRLVNLSTFQLPYMAGVIYPFVVALVLCQIRTWPILFSLKRALDTDTDPRSNNCVSTYMHMDSSTS